MNSGPKLATRFQTAEESPGFLLWKAANTLQRLHARSLRQLDLTPGQFSLLTCLVYLHPRGPVTQAMLAGHAGMDKMTVSDIIKPLLRKCLVTKSRNPGDGRSYLIAPTPAGVEAANAAVAHVEALDAGFFQVVGDLDVLRRELLALIGEERVLAAEGREAGEIGDGPAGKTP